jgi:uncharacterized repeat protein (TIGR01451 family)
MHFFSLTRLCALIGLLFAVGCGSDDSKPIVQPPSSLSYTVSAPVYTKGLSIAPNSPSSSGGAVDVFSVSPALPAGLNLHSATGIITGVPTVISASTSYLVTASNSAGSTTTTVTITVNDVPPAGLTYNTSMPNYTVGVAALPNTPSNTGGTVTSFSVAPQLPAGLSLSTSTGIISGTPTSASAAANYTVTASNTGGSTTATLLVTVNEFAPTGLSYPMSSVICTKGSALTAMKPTNTGGAIATYIVSPALPGGLILSPSTGAISGTPTVISATTSYTVTASNPYGFTTTTVTITVNDAPPTGLAYTTGTAAYTKGVAITPNQPSNSGGVTTSYSVNPALPSGLSISPSTGIISGTPSALSASAIYTVTASNTGGSTTTTLRIAVNDVPPAGLTYTTRTAVYTKGVAIAPNQPSSGGGAVTAYSVSPALPVGLSLSATTGILSGTPTAVTAASNYTISASNSGGSATTALTIAVLDPVLKDTLTVTLDTFVHVGATGLVASIPDQGVGAAYYWILTGGTITSGQGTRSITYSAGQAGPLKAEVLVGGASGSANATVVAVPNAELALPPSVHPGDTWMKASVPIQTGMTYLWTVIPGTSTGMITSGQGTGLIDFSAGTEGTFQIQVNVQNAAGANVSATRTVTVQRGTWLVKNGGASLSSQAAALLPSGRVLSVAGTRAELYDPAMERWVPAADLGDMGTGGITATCLLNGRVLVVGPTSAKFYYPVTGEWIPTGSPNHTRADGHTATLLQSGNVLVVGGGYAEVYDVATGVWADTRNMLSGHYEHTSTLLLDGKVLVAGGNVPEVYDPSTGTWTLTTAVDDGFWRMGQAATLLADGRVLVTGGYTISTGSAHPLVAHDDARIYDPVTKAWSITGSMGDPRYGHTSSLQSDGKVLVVGGGASQPAGEGRPAIVGAVLFDPNTGVWHSTGSLNQARRYHQSISMTGGQMIVFAGNEDGNSLTSTERYDPALGLWTPLGNLGAGRQGHSATLLQDGKVLVTGGRRQFFTSRQSAIPAETSSKIFDPSTHSWLSTGNLGAARCQHASVLLSDGKVMVIGGRPSEATAYAHWEFNKLASVEIYDPATQAWSFTGGLGTARSDATATLLSNGKVLVAGGSATANWSFMSLASAELYDPSTGIWSPTGAMTTARSFHTATMLLNGKVLVVGGTATGTGGLVSAEIYDPATGTWSTTGALGSPRVQFSATLMQDGKVLVEGGFFNWHNGYLATAELYAPASGRWDLVASMGTPSSAHTATLLPNGEVLVTGGEISNSSSLSSSSRTESYSPAMSVWFATKGLGRARSQHSATLLNDGTVLVAFGKDGDTLTEVYMP